MKQEEEIIPEIIIHPTHTNLNTNNQDITEFPSPKENIEKHPTLKNFLTLAQEDQNRPLFDYKDGFILIPSSGIGFYAAWPFFKESKKGAHLIPKGLLSLMLKPFNISTLTLNNIFAAPTSFTYNGAFQSFYVNQTLLEFKEFITNSRYKSKDALQKILPERFESKIKRALLKGDIFLLSAGTSLQYFFLYLLTTTPQNPISFYLGAIADEICDLSLFWAGGRVLRNTIIPNVLYYSGISPLTTHIYYHVNPKANERHRCLDKITQLQQAYLSTLKSARANIESLIQLQQEEKLNEVCDLLNKENPTLIGTFNLLQAICQLASKSITESAIAKGAKTVIKGSFSLPFIISGLTSVEGYFLDTLDNVSKIPGINAFKSTRLAGSIITFSPFAALVINNVSSTANQILESITGLGKGIYTATKAKLSGKKAEIPLMPLPLAYQHNKILIPPLMAIYLLGWYTAGTALGLNYNEFIKYFGNELGLALYEMKGLGPYLATIATNLVNAFPSGPTLSEAARLANAQFGSKEKQTQIKLMGFIDNMIILGESLKPEQFIELLDDINSYIKSLFPIQKESSIQPFNHQIEGKLNFFFQEQTVKELFRKNSGYTSLSHAIEQIHLDYNSLFKAKNISRLSKMWSWCAGKKEEKQPLINPENNIQIRI